MDDSKDFHNFFNNKDFSSALEKFLQLDTKTQESLLSELYQKSQFQRKPAAMSLIVRRLHEEKTFADLHQAWLPTDKWINPVVEGGVSYLQFIPEGASRMINAVSVHNPQEVMTVGFHWVENQAQYQGMLDMVKNIADEPSNQERHDRVKKSSRQAVGWFLLG